MFSCYRLQQISSILKYCHLIRQHLPVGYLGIIVKQNFKNCFVEFGKICRRKMGTCSFISACLFSDNSVVESTSRNGVLFHETVFSDNGVVESA